MMIAVRRRDASIRGREVERATAADKSMEVLDSLAVEGAEEGREGHKGYLQCGGENNVQRPEEEACRALEDDVTH